MEQLMIDGTDSCSPTEKQTPAVQRKNRLLQSNGKKHIRNCGLPTLELFHSHSPSHINGKNRFFLYISVSFVK